MHLLSFDSIDCLNDWIIILLAAIFFSTWYSHPFPSLFVNLTNVTITTTDTYSVHQQLGGERCTAIASTGPHSCRMTSLSRRARTYSPRLLSSFTSTDQRIYTSSVLFVASFWSWTIWLLHLLILLFNSHRLRNLRRPWAGLWIWKLEESTAGDFKMHSTCVYVMYVCMYIFSVHIIEDFYLFISACVECDLLNSSRLTNIHGMCMYVYMYVCMYCTMFSNGHNFLQKCVFNS